MIGHPTSLLRKIGHGQARYGPAVNYPVIAPGSVAWITEAQMIEVDRVMTDDLGISLAQMMENAGRNLARVALDVFEPSRVWIAAGSGGNGGGGLVAARHLANAGVDVAVTTTRSANELTGVPRHQFEILQRMDVTISDAPVDADLAIDALIGYSLRGEPHGRTAELIAETSPGDLVAYETHLKEWLATLDSKLVDRGDAADPLVVEDLHLTRAMVRSILESLPGLSITLPTRAFSDKLVVEGSERSVHLLTFGGGHTDSDTLLFLPDSSVLFAGCNTMDVGTSFNQETYVGADILQFIRIGKPAPLWGRLNSDAKNSTVCRSPSFAHFEIRFTHTAVSEKTGRRPVVSEIN